MKIALIGYGKMGKEIEEIAIASGHEIVLKIDSSNRTERTKENLSKADVAIEFTRPEGVFENLIACMEASLPVVTGTTGWNAQESVIREKCQQHHGAILSASNFSIGVQVFFHLNKTLAAMMNKLENYDVRMEEIHHLQKLDAPSGTAITLANDILNQVKRKNGWKLDAESTEQNQKDLLIRSIRKDQVVGIHTVTYESEIDKITLIHEAKNRKGFAIGALEAACWLKDRKGFFTMEDYIHYIFFSLIANK